MMPAMGMERESTMPPSEITATSVVPPPTSTTMLPSGAKTGRPEPKAEAKGLSIRWMAFFLAPALVAASRITRFSTGETRLGTVTYTRGFSRWETPMAFLMK